MKRVSGFGFTLIELLVVVAIIGLLIAILIPSINRARERARRVTCGTNLKAQGVSCAMYAAQYNDNLPQFTKPLSGGGIYWLWDESSDFGDALLGTLPNANNNMTKLSLRKEFYCPSNTGQNDDALWHWPNLPGGTAPNFGYTLGSQPPMHVLGYAYMNDRGVQGGLNASQNRNLLLIRSQPPLGYHSKLIATTYASGTELALDAILSAEGPGPAQAGFNYTRIQGGWTQFHTTSHVEKGVPAGGNVMCFDGSVAWKKWNGGAGAVGVNVGPYFWFPK